METKPKNNSGHRVCDLSFNLLMTILDKIESDNDQLGKRGYVVGFNLLINWVKGQRPTAESI